MKTIRQLADELSVTKQAVQKRISREPLLTSINPHLIVKDGVKYINGEGERIIKAAFVAKGYIQEGALSIDTGIDKEGLSIDKSGLTIDTGIDKEGLSIDTGIGKEDLSIDKNSDVHTLMSILREQLKTKDTLIIEQQKSIGELTAALENVTASLHAAQALHAGTMKTQFVTDKSGPTEVQEVAMPTEPEKAARPKNIFQRIFKRG